MKANFLSLAIWVTISLLPLSGKATQLIGHSITDTVCCTPDSLKVISKNFPVFCVGWKVSTDSNCIQPYGFEIQWAPFPGIGPWTTRTIIYTGGPWVIFCDSVSVCRTYQWRVRTICTTADGVTTYSNWIPGPKFAMTCGDIKSPDDSKKNPGSPKPVIKGTAVNIEY